uniref:Winged helix DNA-binding domain-containing protein n=1 Tax=Aetherobacter fasciculatus TaxID=888830 RepID=A0A3Q8I1J5_9BACT|nr:hypothetical protein [Aetherobacter fasciculatus]
MTLSIDAAELVRLRLRSQGLTDRSARAPRDAVRRLLAMQAQDFAAALWAIGVRASGATVTSVTRALEDGHVVRSWPMRGTLHFVAAEDLGWMLRLCTPRVLRSLATRHRGLELDEAVFRASRALAERLLSGGGRASREEFLAALEAGGIATAGQRGYHIITYLAMTGTLCWGPPKGTQQALVLVEEWIRDPRALDREEALGELVARYVSGHGPATLRDFLWWSKLTMADAKIGFAVAAGALAELTHAGVTYWATKERLDEAISAEPIAAGAVMALPGFDEHLLGYTDRDLVLPREHAAKIVPGANGIFLSLITVDGLIVGTWRRAAKGGAVVVTPAPFTRMSARTAKGFASAVSAYAAFLGVAGSVAPAPQGA